MQYSTTDFNIIIYFMLSTPQMKTIIEHHLHSLSFAVTICLSHKGVTLRITVFNWKSEIRKSKSLSTLFWHWPLEDALDTKSDSPSHMKSPRIWINRDQNSCTIGHKTQNNIGEGKFKLSIFFRICRQVKLNTERTVEEKDSGGKGL